MDIVSKNTKIKLTGSAKLAVLVGSSTPGIVLDIEEADLTIDLCTDTRELMDVRRASALGRSYVTSDSFDIRGANQLQLWVSFIKAQMSATP